MPSANAAAFLAAIVESSNDAIVGKTLDGTILSWNVAAERIFGYSAEEILGRPVRLLIPDDRQQEEDAIIARIRRGVRVPTFETVRLRKDGSEIQVEITVSPVRDSSGNTIGASKIARDISEHKRVLARLEDSEQRFRLLADNMAQLAWIADRDGSVFWYNRRWFEFTGTRLDEVAGSGWVAVVHPEHRQRVVDRWNHHLATGEEWEDTFAVRGASGEYRWFLSRALPIQNPQGRIIYWFGTNTDITEMRDAEQRIQLLMMEVNHRSKNMLAVIQALARRTAAQGGDFVARFEQRIQALAANQDLLVTRAWASVPIEELVAAQLQRLGELARQVSCDGPEVLLAPAAAETIAMAIHEMATNAVKYGALSNPEGKVEIRWDFQQQDGSAIFSMSWAESGGPPVSEPIAPGFGTRIIVDVPRAKLEAEVSVTYASTGFRWSLCCPIAKIAGNSAFYGPEPAANV